MRRLRFLAMAMALAFMEVGAIGNAAAQAPEGVSFFRLEMEGGPTGFFIEISGLGSESEVVEHRVIGPDGKEILRKLPGATRYPNVTLKRGLTSTTDLWDWRSLIDEGNVNAARKNGSLVLYDVEGKPIARWNLTNAWPSKLELASTPSGRMIETITIACEHIERVSP